LFFLFQPWDVTHGRQDIMAMKSESEYQQAARQRWPQLNIHGDGPCAIVCPVSYSVFLYPFAMMAMSQIALDHSNQHCKDEHKLVELKAVPQRAPLTLRNRAALERD
jgi:hypothetical protein